jgi:uncharacterized membrane protein
MTGTHPHPHPRTRTRIWRELRPFLAPAIAVVLYAILLLVHATVAGDRGVITPSGALDATLIAVTVATFAMRMVVLILVPFVVTYRLVLRALRVRTGRGPVAGG